jgi:ATP-binding protein involved in chromosome partitioning
MHQAKVEIAQTEIELGLWLLGQVGLRDLTMRRRRAVNSLSNAHQGYSRMGESFTLAWLAQKQRAAWIFQKSLCMPGERRYQNDRCSVPIRAAANSADMGSAGFWIKHPQSPKSRIVDQLPRQIARFIIRLAYRVDLIGQDVAFFIAAGLRIMLTARPVKSKPETGMSEITQARVLEALKAVSAPEGGDIVSRGLVSGIFIASGKVFFSVTVPSERAKELEPLRLAAEKAVTAIPGVVGAIAALTAEKKAGPAPTPQRPSGHARQGVPGVGSIIAVASGKGGVGKSTTAVNLALALKANGLRVGILDADVYGPSMPRLLGLKGRPQTVDGKVLKPMEAYGVKAMSMGFLVDEDTPMIWRGPMVMSALTQMLREVEWGDLDVLIVDMPPGTGDAQLTMAQQVALAGAVIVSTPQDLALIDARKGLNMFRKVDVPVLGIVENMSYFIAPDTGKRYDIFGHGGAKAEAERLAVPFLGEVPLDMSLRENSDNGTPLVATEPDGAHAKIYRGIATQVWNSASAARSGGRAAPAIVFE